MNATPQWFDSLSYIIAVVVVVIYIAATIYCFTVNPLMAVFMLGFACAIGFTISEI